MKRKTFKAVAYEHSHDTFANVYCIGDGVGFSDSVAKAIAVAKDRALLSLEADGQTLDREGLNNYFKVA
jgi:hypothetical protein